MSAVEAMAYGVPAYALDVMGLRDYCTEVFKSIFGMAICISRIHEMFAQSGDFLWAKNTIRQKTLDRFSDSTVIPQIEEMLK